MVTMTKDVDTELEKYEEDHVPEPIMELNWDPEAFGTIAALIRF